MAWHSGKQHLGPQVTRTVLQAGQDEASELMAAAERLTKGILDPAVIAGSGDFDRAFLDLASNDRVIGVVTVAGWLRSLGVT